MYSHVSRITFRRFRRLQFSTSSPFSTKSRFAPASPHTTSCGGDEISIEGSDPPQVYPLSGYYSDILSGSSPHAHRAGSSRSVTPPSTTTRQSPVDKMSIIFGSRLAGPGYRSTRYNPSTTPVESTWKTVNGVAIPPRPAEPDNCCMSGCVHCVWDDFREDMEAWAARARQAQARATSPAGRDMRQDPRPEVESSSSSMDDDGGGSETSWAASVAVDDELFAGIPVGIREFMKVEKKLRDKHRKERDLV